MAPQVSISLLATDTLRGYDVAVSGVVVDLLGEPVAGAELWLELRNPAGATWLTQPVITDGNGVFAFVALVAANVAPGNGSVFADSEGARFYLANHTSLPASFRINGTCQ